MPDLIGSAIAWFLAWLFAVAALHKLRAPVYYRSLVTRWLPGVPGVRQTVFAVAALELILALSLLVPALRSAALLAAAMLLLLYAALMGSQLAQGRRDVQCGCAGPASAAVISPALLLRNLLCGALALTALVPSVDVDAGVAGVGLALGVALFMVFAYLASEQMIANAQAMAGD